MSNITSKTIALIFSIIFIGVGVLGFIPNPLVSTDGLFEVNIMHNFVHILTGIVFYVAKSRLEKTARITLQIVGIAYVGVSILGFFTEGNMLLGLVHINEPDKWLHVALAAVILASGFLLPKFQSQAGEVQ